MGGKEFTIANLNNLNSRHPHTVGTKYDFLVQGFAHATSPGVTFNAGDQITAAHAGNQQVETGTYSGVLTSITRTSTSRTGTGTSAVLSFPDVSAADASFEASGASVDDTYTAKYDGTSLPLVTKQKTFGTSAPTAAPTTGVPFVAGKEAVALVQGSDEYTPTYNGIKIPSLKVKVD